MARDAIDNVLLKWYSWTSGYVPALGFGRLEPACRGFSISRQWMDDEERDEEIDRNLTKSTGQIVEPLVLQLDIRHRIAINTAMRNFHSGAHVWVNPRYPETQAGDYAAAKDLLRPSFRACRLIA